jgi:hypothetical protein
MRETGGAWQAARHKEIPTHGTYAAFSCRPQISIAFPSSLDAATEFSA